MDYILEVIDKSKRKIYLTTERYKHLQKHRKMQDSAERIKTVIQNPTTIRYNEEDESIRYFYKEYKENDAFERYILVSVKYLNGNGFVITSFYTNKITGSKWKI